MEHYIKINLSDITYMPELIPPRKLVTKFSSIISSHSAGLIRRRWSRLKTNQLQLTSFFSELRKLSAH